MQFRLSTLIPVAALAAVVAAAPAELIARGGDGTCTTGTIQCCNGVIDCVGVATAADCTQSPYCCIGNTFTGVIGVGCTYIPITINL